MVAMRGPILLAALTLCVRIDASDFAASLADAIKSQVNQQVQASINQAVPRIVSNSANNAINQQLATFTANQPAAAAAPAATQATAPAARPAAQPAAAQPAAVNTPAAAAQPAANQPAAAAQPAATNVNSNTNAVVTQAAAAGNTAVGGGGTTLSTKIVPSGQNVGTQLSDSLVPSASTLAGGSIVTLSGVSSTLSSVVVSSSESSTLTDAQGSIVNGGNGTRTAATGHVQTAQVGNTDLSGNNTTHSTTGLSKSASVGLGVGLGLFVVALIGGLFLFCLFTKRKKERRHSRAPSLIISGPLDKNLNPVRSSTVKSTGNISEADGKAMTELEHTVSTSTRSPISPWTPGSEGTSLAQQPSIFEMIGSLPPGVEMAGSAVASEVVGSPTEAEVEGPLPVEETTPRPFSYQKTPTEAFGPEESDEVKPRVVTRG